ncbi:hypothetical protein [Brevibacterium aurantiacum]|uniref:Uncharacterized protein n=1 Tax=Brevibacterium aurantiacum TaxID=273384 RepID=A0A2H1JFF7_BREAU|nr:hypothetical protein [Brevibacterium aurantiacum]SMX86169.1 hypothetical protein BAURA86_01641 [Brevibacterium aurantiacum]
MMIPPVFNRSAGASHAWHVGATCLLVGAIFSLAWALSRAGMLDLAATGLAFFVTALARQMGIGLSTAAPREFEGSANLLRQLQADFARWLSTRSVIAHALIALGYTIAFLLARAALSGIMTVIASPWVALAAGLALAAAVASPSLVRSLAEAAGGRSQREESVGERGSDDR